MRGLLAVVAAMVPALLWYAWAAHLVAAGGGSRASADNRAIWMGLLAPVGPVAARDLDAGLAVPGGPGVHADRGRAGDRRPGRRARIRTLAGLGSHVAGHARDAGAEAASRILFPDPGAGRRRRGSGWRWIGWRPAGDGPRRWPPPCLLIMACVQARSTWRTPPEWTGLEAASRAVAEVDARRRLGRRARGPAVPSPTAAAAGWSGPRPPRGGRPASGTRRRGTRSAGRSTWWNTTGSAGLATSPTSAIAATTRAEWPCTTRSADDTRSLWIAPRSSSPTWKRSLPPGMLPHAN